MSQPSIEERVVRFKTDYTRLCDEIGKVIVGQNDVVQGVILSLIAGGHVLLEGVPGLGKTRLVRALSEALHLNFSRIQFTPDLMPADVVGTQVVVTEESGNKHFEFRRGPIFANIVLADEINRATPKTQSALLEAMQEASVTVGKETMALDSPFLVLATQNPLEMEGTYPLPEAQLDRFFMKWQVRFPGHEVLHTILDRTTGNEEPTIEPVLTGEQVLQMRQLALDVPVARHVQDYAVRVVEATQKENNSQYTSAEHSEEERAQDHHHVREVDGEDREVLLLLELEKILEVSPEGVVAPHVHVRIHGEGERDGVHRPASDEEPVQGRSFFGVRFHGISRGRLTGNLALLGLLQS